MKDKRVTYGSFLAVVPLIFLLLFYFYPLSAIFKMSFISEDVFQFEKLRHILTNSYYLNIIGFTLFQALVSTLITLFIALPGAYVFARYEFFGKNILKALATVPFVLPTVVVAASFQALLGPKGVLSMGLSYLSELFSLDLPHIYFEMDQGLEYVFLAHLFYNYSIILRMVGTFWSRLDHKSEQAARTLGASEWKVFRHITLPLLRPSIMAASLLVFIFCFSSFGVILILGGSHFSTLEIQIYRESLHLFNLSSAATLSLIQILFTLILAFVYTRLQKKIQISLKPISTYHSQRRAETIPQKLIVYLNIGFIYLFFILPILALLLRSVLTDTGFSLIYYKALFENPSQSYFFVSPIATIFYSLGIAAITVIFSLCLGILSASYLNARNTFTSSVLNPIFMLPLSTSAVTLGLGFIIALSVPGLNLRTSFIIFPIAHTLIAFPFVIRILLPTFKSIPKHLEEAAKCLGARPHQIFRFIHLPLLGKSILQGAVFSFTISLGEFGASSFIARPNLPTLSVSIYRFLGQPGALNYGRAIAMSALLMMITLLGFMMIERCKGSEFREF